MIARKTKETESEMFLRLWNDQPMTPTLARQILKLDWTEADRKRMHTLANRNREGEITSAELQEMDQYLNVSYMLSILQLRARKTLRAKVSQSKVRV